MMKNEGRNCGGRVRKQELEVGMGGRGGGAKGKYVREHVVYLGRSREGEVRIWDACVERRENLRGGACKCAGLRDCGDHDRELFVCGVLTAFCCCCFFLMIISIFVCTFVLYINIYHTIFEV